MIAIVCADKNWGIGLGGELLVRIPEDMKRFRRLTLGKTIIVGRKTLETFPGGKPLPGRSNIVLTRNGSFTVAGASTATSVESALEMTLSLPPDDVFVVGGQEVYEAMLPYCHTAYVTRLAEAFEADIFFPPLDKLEGWRLDEASEWREHQNVKYRYETWLTSVDIIEEYNSLPPDTRAEIVDGRIVMLAMPSTDHQEISSQLIRQLGNFLFGKRCKLYHDINVRLPDRVKNQNVFGPDIVVQCDLSKIQNGWIIGAPDFIIEIISPSNASHDTITKLNKYMDAGVREYWIVDPMQRKVFVYLENEAPYFCYTYEADANIPISILEGCVIDMATVFPPRENTLE